MSALALGLTLWLGAPLPADANSAREHLARGEYADALRALEDEPDALVSAQLRGAILGEGRDFQGALAAVRAARERFPDDVELAWREANLLLWLQAGEPALRAVDETESALERSAWSAAQRQPWLDSTALYRERASQLAERSAGLARAERRSRLTALGLLGVALGVLGVLARAPRRSTAD